MCNSRAAVMDLVINRERLLGRMSPKLSNPINRASVTIDRLFREISRSIESILWMIHSQVGRATNESQITDLLRSTDQLISGLAEGRKRQVQSIIRRLRLELAQQPTPPIEAEFYRTRIQVLFGLDSEYGYSPTLVYEYHTRRLAPAPMVGYLIPVRHHNTIILQPCPYDTRFREWYEREPQAGPIVQCAGCPRCRLEENYAGARPRQAG
jgi:hypothetical protein